MRFESPPRRSPFSLSPWVRGIIVANAVVYLLTITVFTDAWALDLTAFDPTKVAARWWTFGSYMFVHASFLHLTFNMLMLFFFGPAVEERMGGSGFGLFYFTCGFGGAVLSLAMSSISPAAPIVGASGAVLGVALAFAASWPNAPIYIFPLPVPIKVKWLVAFLVITNLWMAWVGAHTGISYTTHLGGLLFGFIYLKGEERVMRRARPFIYTPGSMSPSSRPLSRTPVHAAQPRQQAPAHPPDARDEAINRLLDKISASGLGSLTPEELELLDEASKRLRQH